MRRRTATAYRLRPGSVEDLANSDGTFVLTATRKGIVLRDVGLLPGHQVASHQDVVDVATV